MMDDINKMSDHDLLITMHEQIRGLKADIKDLKDGTSAELNDHEIRIKSLELKETGNKVRMYIYLSLGAFIAGILIYHVMGQ
jgi:hypothetical protein